MGQRLLQRRLAQASTRLRELKAELRIAEDQLSHLVDDADEKSLRALVSETPGAEFEYREARRHADVIEKHHRRLLTETAEIEQRINDLLDRMKEPTA